MLYVRMALYAVSMLAAGAGIAQYDPVTQVLSIDLNNAAEWIFTGVSAFAATFAASRYAKSRGGQT